MELLGKKDVALDFQLLGIPSKFTVNEQMKYLGNYNCKYVIDKSV